MTTWAPLPAGPFDVVLADPPWAYGPSSHTNRAENHYNTVPTWEIMTLPVRSVLARDAVVFVWGTCPLVHHAVDLLRGWGLHVRGMPFVWIKTTQAGKPLGAQGIRPTLTKPQIEFVLAGTTRAKGRPLPLVDENVMQTIFAPRAGHSVKPPEVHERINRMYPAARKLELFARRPVAGWTVWGNDPAVSAARAA